MVIKQHEREKLSALNIDYFIVDYYITVYTDGPEGKPYCNGNLDVILHPTLEILHMWHFILLYFHVQY